MTELRGLIVNNYDGTITDIADCYFVPFDAVSKDAEEDDILELPEKLGLPKLASLLNQPA